MAIGAIIETSLSYVSQLSSAGYTCNAERFNDKAGLFVGSINGDHSAYAVVSKTPC